MHRILLLNHVNTYFTGLLPLALMLKNSGEFEPVILFSRNYPTVLDDIETCNQHQLEVCLIGELSYLNDLKKNPDVCMIQNAEKKNKPNRLLKKLRSSSYVIKNLIQLRLATSSLGFILELKKLSRQIIFIRQLIVKHRIELLVLPADNRYDFSLYVRAAHQEGIGAIVVPQFMAGHLEWAEYVKNQSMYHIRSLMNRLAVRLFPRWFLNYKCNQLIALPGTQVLARELLKVAPPLPWVLHSGGADTIAIESEAILNYCLNEGLPEEQLRITGSITHDHLFDIQVNQAQKKSELLTNLGLAEDLPIILSALPCDMVYTGRPECDFKDYEELVIFWCEIISSIQGYHHVLALHPSVHFDEMKYIEKFGLRIARMPTASLIPLCDIYVSSVSSTIQWAIAAGKPVLNYDVYRYRYTDYQKVPGVITVEEKEDFLAQLEKLAYDNIYLENTVLAQQRESMRWGNIDGEAGLRLRNLFAKTIRNYKENI